MHVHVVRAQGDDMLIAESPSAILSLIYACILF